MAFNQFAARLTELLNENKISKRELAKRIGVSATSVSGKIQPTVENVYLICEYFQVSADYMLGLKEI